MNGSLRILHLEDDVYDAQLVETTLRDAGMACEFKRIQDRAELVAALDDPAWDMILADYALPSFDGLSALKMVCETLPATPFVFVTGVMGEDRAVETLKLGATDYVLKDHLSKLPAAVHRALQEAAERHKRRQAEDSLRASEQRYRRLMERNAAGVICGALDGRILECNDALACMLGYQSRRELQASHTAELYFSPADCESFFSRLQEEKTLTGEEICLKRKDGSPVWALVNVSILEPEPPEEMAFEGTIIDVSASRQAHRELQEKNLELEKATRAKDRFLAGMSHELRTPLNAILGFTGMLLMKLYGPLNPVQEKQLKTVQSSASHLLSLINDLLDLSKIESGESELRLESVACQKVIDEVAATLAPLAESKGLRLEVKEPRKDVVVRADQRALTQIVLNLANNAIKFTEKGFVRLELCRQEKGGAFAEISVTDSGIGIKPEDQARLFNAFVRAEGPPGRHEQGTGLGLYLSRKLAGRLGGSIQCESRYGGGSRFTLTVPRQ